MATYLPFVEALGDVRDGLLVSLVLHTDFTEGQQGFADLHFNALQNKNKRQ